MKPKLEVSVSEMMQLRNDGYSNADIARILDISLPSVYKYIGKQGCHIPSATASFITKPTTNVPDDTTTQQEVMVISRVVAIDGYLFELSSDGIAVSNNDGQYLRIPVDEADRFTQAFMAAKAYMETHT